MLSRRPVLSTSTVLYGTAPAGISALGLDFTRDDVIMNNAEFRAVMVRAMPINQTHTTAARP
jgi:hypothetical protein